MTELAPNFGDAYGMLGWHLIVQGKFEEAREPCRKAHELVPEYFGWAANLGHTYLLTRDAATARRFYEKTLPLLNSEDDFLTGPVADFELFIENGWQVETCRQELAWMKREFETIYRAYIEANSYCV